MSDCLFLSGPIVGLCASCGRPLVAHAPTPSLATDPFAAWCAFADSHRAFVLLALREGAPGDLSVATCHVIADALEALAAGRRP